METIVYYIIIGAIYLFFQYKKAQKAAAQRKAEVEKALREREEEERAAKVQGTAGKAASTSDERLRKLEELLNKNAPAAKPVQVPSQPAKRPVYEPASLPSYTDYESKEYRSEYMAREVKNINPYKEYASKTLSEDFNDGYKAYNTKAKTVNAYADKIKKKGGLKEAFVMSEILQRKYQ